MVVRQVLKIMMKCILIFAGPGWLDRRLLVALHDDEFHKASYVYPPSRYTENQYSHQSVLNMY